MLNPCFLKREGGEMNYLIKGGKIVDPSQGFERIADILVIDGIIESIDPDSVPDGVETIDASGKLVFPGLVDIHVHAREPGEEYKETIETASMAAAAGGFTTIVTMANTKPPIDTADRVRFVYERAENVSVHVYPVGAVSKELSGEQLAEMADMAESGAVAFSDDGNPIANPELMRNALAYADQLELPILVHEVDPVLASGGQIHEGEAASISGLRGIPSQAETAMIFRDIELLKLSGGRLHIQHVTVEGSVELIRQAKLAGMAVTCEVTPHHLLLTDMDVVNSGFDSNFKVMPPLRSERDRQSLLEALVDGTIDAIATDHAPHALHEKDNPFEMAPFGIVGLETALSLVWTNFVEKGIISPIRMVELMSTMPAKILELPAGSLAKGMAADITVFDPDARWVVKPENFYSRSRNTPFEGLELKGKVVLTMVAGEIVYKSQTV